MGRSVSICYTRKLSFRIAALILGETIPNTVRRIDKLIQDNPGQFRADSVDLPIEEIILRVLGNTLE
jgi:hypothetical protein